MAGSELSVTMAASKLRPRVTIHADLAALFGVTAKRLNEQVKRIAARFPEDFMFRLSAQETGTLTRSHFATGSQKHRDPRFLPIAFTEHGAIMQPPRRVDEPLRGARVHPHMRAARRQFRAGRFSTYANVFRPPFKPMGSLSS